MRTYTYKVIKDEVEEDNEIFAWDEETAKSKIEKYYDSKIQEGKLKEYSYRIIGHYDE